MLDLSFLDVSWRQREASSGRSMSTTSSVRGWRETRVDMTLQLFLDPTERHALGSLVMDALLRLLDRPPDIGPGGHSGERLIAKDAQGSVVGDRHAGRLHRRVRGQLGSGDCARVVRARSATNSITH